MSDAKTVDDVIAALGGKERAAILCDVTEGALRQWRLNGLPPKHWSLIVGETDISYQQLEPLHPDKFQNGGTSQEPQTEDA